MSSRGGVNDDRLIAVNRLNFLHTETVPLESLPSLGCAQVNVQLVGWGFGHPGGFHFQILSDALRLLANVKFRNITIVCEKRSCVLIDRSR